MQRIFSNDIFLNILSTAVAAIVIAIIYFITIAVLTKKTDDPKERHRRKVRLFYVIALFFIFILARIWVEGFTQLLAVLGLVSAALVITNKEIILNFSGWLIIIWRELFTEDDLIEIQQHKGYVRSIRVLYFYLLEVDKDSPNVVTGRVIRIPNGLVITNPIIGFSSAHLLEQRFGVIFEKNSEIEAAKTQVKKAVEDTLHSFYRDKKEYTKNFLIQRSKQIGAKIDLQPVVTIKPKYGLPSGIEVSARYYCYTADQETIEQEIWRRLLESLQGVEKIKLAV